MKFSINAFKTLLGMGDTYRLQKNGKWVNRSDFTQLDIENDWIFSSFNDAQSWLDHTGKIFINGEEANTVQEDVSQLFNDKYDFEIVYHRFTKPKNPIFTVEQIKDALINGDDNFDNSLVIDDTGSPRLIKLVDKAPVQLVGFPVRYETFSADTGYVGSHEISNEDIDNIYMALLHGWSIHLSSGRCVYYGTNTMEYSEDQLRKKINSSLNLLN